MRQSVNRKRAGREETPIIRVVHAFDLGEVKRKSRRLPEQATAEADVALRGAHLEIIR